MCSRGKFISPFLAFFWSFMVSSDFLLISWRDRLYSVERKAKPSMYWFLSNIQRSQTCIYSVFPGCWPLAWSLSSWLAVFFHSSILSWSGVTRPSMRALQREGDTTWEERTRGMAYTFISTAQKPLVEEWQRERKVNRWNGTLKHNNPLKAKKKKEKIALERQNTGDTYLVKWRNFASMLRWRIHILVRAEPTSLVAPWMRQTKQIVTLKIGITDQRCASWPRKIWFSMRTYNTSGGSILKSLILFCQDGGFFFLLEMRFLLQPLGGQVPIVKAEPLNVTFVWGKQMWHSAFKLKPPHSLPLDKTCILHLKIVCMTAVSTTACASCLLNFYPSAEV